MRAAVILQQLGVGLVHVAAPLVLLVWARTVARWILPGHLAGRAAPFISARSAGLVLFSLFGLLLAAFAAPKLAGSFAVAAAGQLPGQAEAHIEPQIEHWVGLLGNLLQVLLGLALFVMPRRAMRAWHSLRKRFEEQRMAPSGEE